MRNQLQHISRAEIIRISRTPQRYLFRVLMDLTQLQLDELAAVMMMGRDRIEGTKGVSLRQSLNTVRRLQLADPCYIDSKSMRLAEYLGTGLTLVSKTGDLRRSKSRGEQVPEIGRSWRRLLYPATSD